MRRIGVAGAVAVVAVGIGLVGGTLARAGDDDKRGDASAELSGYQETPSISTAARGRFRAHLDGGRITFQLRYEGLEGGSAIAAHLHFAQRHVAGDVSAFLCGGGSKAACPAGSGGTVEGTIVSTDVIGPAAQGIAPGQFDELVRAIRAGAVYANVHTATYPTGEIRGQLRAGGHDEDDDD